jgi:hypothetical protein
MVLESKLNGWHGQDLILRPPDAPARGPAPAPAPAPAKNSVVSPRERLLAARLALAKTRERFAYLSREFTALQEEFFEEMVLLKLLGATLSRQQPSAPAARRHLHRASDRSRS